MSEPRQSRDEQFEAEVTDADEIDLEDFPPDRAAGVGDLLSEDVTAADSYAPDDLRRRQRRLRPEAGTEPTAAPLAPEVDPDEPPADSAAALHRPGDSWPAEEAALHVVEDDEA